MYLNSLQDVCVNVNQQWIAFIFINHWSSFISSLSSVVLEECPWSYRWSPASPHPRHLLWRSISDPWIENITESQTNSTCPPRTDSPVEPADQHLVSEAHPSPELEAGVCDLPHQSPALQLAHGGQLGHIPGTMLWVFRAFWSPKMIVKC